MKFNFKKPLLLVAFLTLRLSCNEKLQKKATKQVNQQELSGADTKRLLKEINADKKNKQISAFFAELNKKRGFNGTVLVSQKGQVIYKEAFGYFNREKKQMLEVNSVFQLASVSKQFTAVAILMLKERGKLKLDDPIAKYIKGFPYEGINIRMLLNHRSGLPDYRYFCDEAYCCKKEAISNKQAIDLMIKHKPGIYYKPDKHFDYNNTNYMLLATIIENVTHKKYAQFLKENIFTPLKMRSTFVYDKVDVPANVALGYNAGFKRVWNDYQNGVVGDKNIYSTVDDLHKWDKALYTEKLLKQSTLKLAFLAYSKEMKTKNYGFGFRLKCLPNGDDLVFHGGWWRGYNNLFYRRIKDQASIIVLSNRVNFCFNDLQKVWDILDERKTKPSQAKEQDI